MAKKNLTITLYMSELIYDIQNKTYLTGRSRTSGNNHEEVAHMQANDDDENIDQIVRSISAAFGNAKTQLSEFIEATGTTSSNQLLDKSSNLSIVLAMPSNFNQAVNDAVTAAVHGYMVNRAIGEWFTITDKADATDYISLSAANIEELRNAINKRVRPTRTNITN